MIVHLVTDRRRLAPGASLAGARACLRRQAEYAIAAGVDGLQVRERDLDARDFVSLVADLVRLAEGSATRILVNDRLDVALAAGAHGVHLRADSIPASRVRALAPETFLIGCSVHSIGDAEEASAADYLVAGTVWSSESKPHDHRLLGVDGLAAIVRACRKPVLAIGGVTAARVAAVASTGAAGIAAIGLFTDASRDHGCRAMPLDSVVRPLRDWFDTSRSHS